MRHALDRERLRTVYDRVARRYDLQNRFLLAGADERGRRMVVEQAVRHGNRVLDCGAGTGSTSLLAAKTVGAQGKVVLLDMSDGMLAVARRKAMALGVLDRLEFVTGDICQLPFDDGSFDVVLSTYSVCPLAEPEKGAVEVFRVVRPGGRAGFAHSTNPANAFARRLADLVENAVWHFPSISLGCRSVSVLPALEEAGARVVCHRMIGVPWWPLVVVVVAKPE